MNNTQMSQQQAVEQVIKLKKQYESESKNGQGFQNTDRAKELINTASQIRQQFGLDENKYGANASLSDAYMNYHNEFGNKQQGQNIQQQGNINNQSNNYSNSDSRLQELLNMLQQSTSSGLDSQKAQYDKVLEGQLADLERQLNEAVQQGEMSVNEAKDAFESKKQEIQGLAYQQSEATKAYAGNLGIQHSPASIGMQQGDNARINKLHNTNISDRDKRIAEVKDRINLIRQQKSISESQYRAEHGYNIIGAEAQAQQQYMQQVANIMGQDYFNKQGFEHDKNMQDLAQQYNKDNMATQQQYNQDNIRLEFDNKIKEYTHQSALRLSEMAKEKDYRMEEIGVMFENHMVEMAAQFGFEREIQAMRNSGQLQAINAQINADIQKEMRMAKNAEEQLRKTYLDPNSVEYRAREKQIKDDMDMSIQSIYANAGANLSVELISNNPNLPPRGSKIEAPYNWGGKEGFGLIGDLINKATGYDKKVKKHINALQATGDLEALLRLGGTYGVDLTPWATSLPNKKNTSQQGKVNSIDRWLNNIQNGR